MIFDGSAKRQNKIIKYNQIYLDALDIGSIRHILPPKFDKKGQTASACPIRLYSNMHATDYKKLLDYFLRNLEANPIY